MAALALLLQGALLALFCWIMARDMQRNPKAGFFHAVLKGFVPVALVSFFSFVSVQKNPEGYAESLALFKAELVKIASSGGGSISAEELSQSAEFYFRFQPAIHSVFWLALLTACALVIRRRLARKGRTLPPPELSRWKAPDGLIWLGLLPAALLLFGQRGWLGTVEPWLRDFGLNVLVVAGSIYLFQGLMILVERLKRLGVPKVVGMLLGLTGLLVASFPKGKGIALALLALGILDTWFDLRGLGIPKPKDSERRQP